MAAWSGFTDDDLERMRKPSHDDERRPRVKKVARHPKTTNQKSKINKSDLVQSKHDENRNMSSEARLAPQTSKEEASTTERAPNIQSHQSKDGDSMEQQQEDEKSNGDVVLPKEVKELDEEEGLSVELENAEKFQQQQKVIEEANKQKKALLSRAIEERRKKAQAESAKLIKIQKQLAHLDTLLTTDVGIIRDKIEIASLDYAHAQKRYEKAEKEFIEAKMDLFQKSEDKEKLTEHLYTIIHQNEVRKAKKLVQLMDQLAMEVSAEEMEMAIQNIPPLTNFNAVTTLHQPGRRESESRDKNHNQELVPTIENIPAKTDNTNGLPPSAVSPESESTHAGIPTPGKPPTKEDEAILLTSGDGVVAGTVEGKDTDHNDDNNEKSKNFANSSSPTDVSHTDTIKSDQMQVEAVHHSSENAGVSNESATSSSETSAATTSSSASDHQESPPSQQSQQPIEDKPAKGWSLPFM